MSAWRVGRKVGRTIYDADDNLIGVMDTREYAALAAAAPSLVALLEEIAPTEEDLSKSGHLNICSFQGGDAADCHVCSRWVRARNLLNSVEESSK